MQNQDHLAIQKPVRTTVGNATTGHTKLSSHLSKVKCVETIWIGWIEGRPRQPPEGRAHPRVKSLSIKPHYKSNGELREYPYLEGARLHPVMVKVMLRGAP